MLAAIQTAMAEIEESFPGPGPRMHRLRHKLRARARVCVYDTVLLIRPLWRRCPEPRGAAVRMRV